MHALMRPFFALFVGLGLSVNPAIAQSAPAYQSEFAEDATVFYDIDVGELTPSDQRIIVRAHIEARAQVVFDRMTDHDKLHEWMPGVEHPITIDHSNSVTPGMTDVGSVRTALFNGDTVSEEFRGWVPGRVWAYTVLDVPKSPVTNHLGLITFEDDGVGGVYLTWRQYFQPVGFKGRLAPMIMRGIMKRAFKNIAGEFGGALVSPRQARRAAQG